MHFGSSTEEKIPSHHSQTSCLGSGLWHVIEAGHTGHWSGGSRIGWWRPEYLKSDLTFAAYSGVSLGKLLSLSEPFHIIFVVVRIMNCNDSTYLSNDY